MTGIQSAASLFTTAPRCKIYINNKAVAYAIGFNFNISVTIQPVMVVGEVAPVALEQTMYNTVTGTMQIVRLKNAAVIGTGTAGTPLAQGELFAHTDPSTVLLARGFSVQVYLRKATIAASQSIADAAATAGITDTSQTQKMAIQNGLLEEIKWLEIQGCRITGRSTNISMGQLVNEPLNFQGLLALREGTAIDGDTGVAQE